MPGFVGPVLLSVLRIAAPDWLSAVGLLRVVLVLVHVAPPVFLVNKLAQVQRFFNPDFLTLDFALRQSGVNFENGLPAEVVFVGNPIK